MLLLRGHIQLYFKLLHFNSKEIFLPGLRGCVGCRNWSLDSSESELRTSLILALLLPESIWRPACARFANNLHPNILQILNKNFNNLTQQKWLRDSFHENKKKLHPAATNDLEHKQAGRQASEQTHQKNKEHHIAVVQKLSITCWQFITENFLAFTYMHLLLWELHIILIFLEKTYWRRRWKKSYFAAVSSFLCASCLLASHLLWFMDMNLSFLHTNLTILIFLLSSFIYFYIFTFLILETWRRRRTRGLDRKHEEDSACANNFF